MGSLDNSVESPLGSTSGAESRETGAAHNIDSSASTSILCDVERPRLIAICAEPGMGRHKAISGALARLSRQGVQTIRRDFSASPPEAACRSLSRLAKRLSQTGEHVVVGIDDMPPSDEACVRRQARALRRVLETGSSAIFSLVPEARQLLEALPECLVISSSTLLRGQLRSEKDAPLDSDVLRVTRGLPSLVNALTLDGYFTSSGELPVAYYDALGSLLASSLRSSLSDEDRRLRLCLILMGSGYVQDLKPVLGSVHLDVLGELRDTAPIFGISSDLTLFSCLTSVAPHALVICLRYISNVCALFPDVVRGCFRALVACGSIEHAAALAKLPECSECLVDVVEHAIEFADAGEIRLVHQAATCPECSGDEYAQSVEAVARAFDMKGAYGALTKWDATTPVAGGIRLLGETRRILWGKLPSVSVDLTQVGSLEHKLAVHIEACSRMMHGSFSTALSLLVSMPSESGSPGLSSMLLALDEELARLLVGGKPETMMGSAEAAQNFFSRHGLVGMNGYLAIVRMVDVLMRPVSYEPDELGRLAARYERSGDALVQVVALIAGTIADLRHGSATSAQVRASLAHTLSQSFDTNYLSRVSALLGDIACVLSDDELGAKALSPNRDDLDEASALIWETLLDGEEPVFTTSLREEAPRDALWLLRVLSHGIEGFSENLVSRMPKRWRRAASTGVSAVLTGQLHEVEMLPKRVPDPDKPVELQLLGGISLTVRGKRIPDWKLERRSAKSMLEYLVLRGGSAKRFQVVEQVWTDGDYLQGFNRVYQTTSTLRALVAEIDDSLELIVASRTSGEITVDTGIMRCDVDEFKMMAREAVDNEDDAMTLECARAAEKIYVGDLYVPPADVTGYIAATQLELRTLYADAMVEGSEAALRLGHARTAARLASNAVLADDMREDAVTALVRALNECGRGPEAQRQKGAYEARRARVLRGGKRARRKPRAGGTVEMAPQQVAEQEERRESAAG